ncbi:MAG: KEOPS complex subunit Pcc1 [Candidatus Altiarchaeota archaeon]
MKHYAKLKTGSGNSSEVCRSLDVDNVSLKDLSIETGHDERSITTLVRSNSIRTMLSTIDDLIRCQIAAESVVKNG